MATRMLLAAALVVVVLLLGAAPAGAHAFLLTSAPADGAALSHAPTTLTLVFDEAILSRQAVVTLRGADGVILQRSGSVTDSVTTTRLVTTLPGLGQGSYSATWQVQSADDRHRSSGTLSFAIGEASQARAVDRRGPTPAPVATVVKWIDLAAVSVLLGALLLSVIAGSHRRFAPGGHDHPRAVLLLIAAAAALTEIAVGVIVLVDAVGTTSLGAALGAGRFGQLWMLREAGFGVAALAAFSARRRIRGTRRRVAAAAAATTVSVVAMSATSHVGSGAGRPSALVILAVHLMSAGAWAGAVMLLAVLAVLNVAGAPRDGIRVLLRGFGYPAAACVAIAATTGLALAGRQVTSADALLATTYGQLLIGKVILVAVGGLLGLRNALRLHRPSPETGSGGYGVLAEGAVLLLVLAAAAGLSVGTPARGPLFAPAVPPGPAVVSAQIGDLLASLKLSPNTVGQSYVTVDLIPTRRPAVSPVTGVTVALTGPQASSLDARSLIHTELSNQWVLGDVDLPAAGQWRLRVGIARAGRAETTWVTTATIGSAVLGRPRPMLSDRPWEHGLNRVAVLLLLLAGGSFALTVARTRGRASATTAPPSAEADKVVTVSGLR